MRLKLKAKPKQIKLGSQEDHLASSGVQTKGQPKK